MVSPLGLSGSKVLLRDKAFYRRAWMMVSVAIVFQALTLGIHTYSFTFWILPWSEEFNASRANVMVAATLANIFLSTLSPLSGKVLDRVPVQYVTAFGLVVFALGWFLISRSTALWQVILLYGVVISFGLSFCGALTGQWLVVQWFDRYRGTALGMVVMGPSLGGFIMPPIATFLLENYGWRFANQFFALIAIGVLLPMVLLLLRAPKMSATEASQVQNNAEVEDRLTVREIVFAKKYWLIVASMLPLVVSLVLVLNNIAPFGVDLGISAQQSALLTSVFALGTIIGKIGSGVMSDFMGFKRVYWMVSLMLMLGLLLMSTNSDYTALIAACALVGTSAGTFLTLTAAVVSRLYPSSSFGLAVGLTNVPGIVIAILIPLSALVRDLTGTYTTVWISILMLTVLSTLAMKSLREE